MSPTKPTLAILAAGMGSRYGGLKQLDPVGPNGETIMDYSVHDAVRAGFGRLVFVIRRDIEQAFRESIGKRFEDKVAVDYVFQELDDIPEGCLVPPSRKKPWGTGHAALAAAGAVREPFGVINADDFYGARSFRMLASGLASIEAEAAAEVERYTMVGFILRQTLSEHGQVCRGICRLDDSNRLVDITERVGIYKEGSGAYFHDESGERRTLTGDEVASMNFWGFMPSFFDRLREQFAAFVAENAPEEKAAAQPEFFLPSVVDRLIESGKAEVEVLTTPDAWFGVTYREDKEFVRRSIQELTDRGVYASNLWED